MLEEKKFQLSYLDEGVPLIIIGLAKKVLIANSLASLVDMMSHTIGAYSAPELWIFAYAFAFQIYFDFSGYTDIARGSAMLLGYRIPINFKMPFIAGSMSDLWRRWHITLTNWLRDYLLIPISGFRGSSLRFAYATMVTMAVCGLWHGASWNYVLWGVYFGACLVINQYFKRWHENTEFLKSFFESKYFHALSVLLTFPGFLPWCCHLSHSRYWTCYETGKTNAFHVAVSWHQCRWRIHSGAPGLPGFRTSLNCPCRYRGVMSLKATSGLAGIGRGDLLSRTSPAFGVLKVVLLPLRLQDVTGRASGDQPQKLDRPRGLERHDRASSWPPPGWHAHEAPPDGAESGRTESASVSACHASRPEMGTVRRDRRPSEDAAVHLRELRQVEALRLHHKQIWC